MRLDGLSTEARDGLYRWSEAVWGDRLAIEKHDASPAVWAWICFLLRESYDSPEWFPKGKFATIQAIESALIREARLELQAREMAR